ncbi:hypothetical protein LIER_25947 [Lithospermum erythrorhizon]|uniref:Uncharacterized protein n=1 Tax=Lithospermum erythrorhizon TaxID=34254 RepID=A0AAV3RA13_LITER
MCCNTDPKEANVDPTLVYIGKEQTEPVVAFSRPPPMPPYLGPLVALLLDAWLKRDKNDGYHKISRSGVFSFLSCHQQRLVKPFL